MFSIMVIAPLLTGSCEVEGSCRSHVLRRGGGMLPSLLFPGGPFFVLCPPTHPPPGAGSAAPQGPLSPCVALAGQLLRK